MTAGDTSIVNEQDGTIVISETRCLKCNEVIEESKPEQKTEQPSEEKNHRSVNL